MASQYHLIPKEGLIKLGHIQSAQGLKGLLRIYSETENLSDICNYFPLWDAKGEQRFKLNFVRMHKESVICSIDGINDRNAAEMLKGIVLCVERKNLPETEEDEFYYADLLGLDVQDMDGKILGKIKSVQNFGSGDLLDVQLSHSKDTVYISFTKDIVPFVHIKDGFIQINPPKGMLDTPKSGARKRRPPEKQKNEL